MSKMIYAIFLVVGTMFSSVCAEDKYYRTEGELSSEEIKDVIKDDLQERTMRYVPKGNEDFAKNMQSTLNKTIDNVFSFSASVQNYFSQFESHPVQINKGEQVHKDLFSVLTNITTYLDENNLSEQYNEDQQKYMKALKEPLDVAKPIQEKLDRNQEDLEVQQQKIDELLDYIEKVIRGDTTKLKRKVQRKVQIYESKHDGETVSTECIASEDDAIVEQKFYGSVDRGLTGIEVLLQSGKTLNCGTKDQPLFSEIDQSENISKLRVKTSKPNSTFISEIEYHDQNSQKKTTGSTGSHKDEIWNDYFIQPDEKLVGYLSSHFKSDNEKRFKSLYMVLEKEEYY